MRKITYEKFLSKYIRPDFIIEGIGGRVAFIEAKTPREKRIVVRDDLLRQIEKYTEEGLKKFGKKFKGVIPVSPDGSNHCFSLEDVARELRKIGLI